MRILMINLVYFSIISSVISQRIPKDPGPWWNPCEQRPAVTGPCRARQERWSYNLTTQNCQRFYYGGCLGNQNNFKTEQSCRKECVTENNQVNVCEQRPGVRGRCKAYRPSFTFNPGSGRCERFIYGGCGGNENRFLTHKECRTRCGDAGIPNGDPCRQSYALSGPCLANIHRYTFNYDSGYCQQFIYGGCQGNENRFRSRAECRRRCGGDGGDGGGSSRVPRRCLLPSDTGFCRAAMPRWYYNHRRNLCQAFTYGGCGGNRNRFISKTECERSCLSVA